jgi:hypothetical protein
MNAISLARVIAHSFAKEYAASLVGESQVWNLGKHRQCSGNILLAALILGVFTLSSCAHPLRKFGIKSSYIGSTDSSGDLSDYPRLNGFYQDYSVILETPIRLQGSSMNVEKLAQLINGQDINSPESLITNESDSVIIFYRNYLTLDSDAFSDASLVMFISYNNDSILLANSYAVEFCTSSPMAYLYQFSKILAHDSGYSVVMKSSEYYESYQFSLISKSFSVDNDFKKYKQSRKKISDLSNDDWLLSKTILGIR